MVVFFWHNKCMETKKIAIVMAVEDVRKMEWLAAQQSPPVTLSDYVRSALHCQPVKNGGPREGGGRPKKET